ATDGDRDIVENRDRISCQNFCAVTPERDVRFEVDRSAATPRIKFQRRISREVAAADIEHTVCAERANFEHICVSTGVIECDRSISVGEREERPAGIITAAIKIDRRCRGAVATKNLKSGIAGDGGIAGNVHVDGSVPSDAAARVIDLSKQRIRRNVCCVYVDHGIPADTAADVWNYEKGIVAGDIASRSKVDDRVAANAAAIVLDGNI